MKPSPWMVNPLEGAPEDLSLLSGTFIPVRSVGGSSTASGTWSATNSSTQVACSCLYLTYPAAGICITLPGSMYRQPRLGSSHYILAFPPFLQASPATVHPFPYLCPPQVLRAFSCQRLPWNILEKAAHGVSVLLAETSCWLRLSSTAVLVCRCEKPCL